MHDDPEWQRLTHDWQQMPSGSTTADVLIAKARKQQHQMKLMAVGEALFAAVVIAQAVELLMRFGNAWLGFVFVACTVVTTFTAVSFWLRRGLWRALALNAVSALQLSQQRAKVRLRLVWLNLLGIALLPPVLTPMGLDLWNQPGHHGFWLLVLAQLTVMVAGLAWCWRTRQQSLAELASSEKLIQEFRTGD